MALQMSSRRHVGLLTHRWLDAYTRSRWQAGALFALCLAVLDRFFALPYPLLPLLALTAVYAALQPLFTALLERFDESDASMAGVELVVDSLLVAGVLYWTGGVESPFHWLWIVMVMLAALAGGRRASLLMAAWITGLDAIEMGFEYWGILPHHHVDIMPNHPLGQFLDPRAVAVNLAINGLFFLVAGYLSGILVETAQHQARRLGVVEQELRRQEETRKRLLRQVVTAQEEERKRVARELHDESSQMVTALLLNVKHVEQQIRAGGDISGPIRTVETLADRALSALGRVIWALRPQDLDELGLVAAVRHAAETVLGASAAVHFDARIDRELPDEVEITLYRVLQEAITNVARHAHARQVWIDLHEDETGVRLRVEDDGVGFRPDEVRREPEGGIGLSGMEERIRLFDGSFELDSAPGRGTRVTAWIPLESEEVQPDEARARADRR
ncbi:sensor histidine kinase [Limnochorda pilosa]|uniref:Oxygen sensor histidine kinase NreB n=1 Tax=Limnochorda pilosa TaxID=1555112 RepID=A0A0K2SGW3_LIMPI|nr:sensor histidine kinase [Limnochorda pilosa]BAS26074.1 hypothetical protein LIP_0217 [Limnochorda pilosa]